MSRTKQKDLGLFDEFEKIQPASTSSKRLDSTEKKKKNLGFQSASSLFDKYQVKETNKYITQEFQSFGCYLAEILSDKTRTSLYIRLAKQIPRGTLESALRFVVDSQARNKAKLFMWKLKQIKDQQKTASSTEKKEKR